MDRWQKQIQIIINEIDRCIQTHKDENLTLRSLSRRLGYSEFYTARKFKEITGVQFRDYLCKRKLTFALKEIRDRDKRLLDIGLDYGFSSHEAFTRAFKKTYGITPSEYRRHPRPLILRTKITLMDHCFSDFEERDRTQQTEAVRTYFVTIPAHKFLYIKNAESNGYWDFWQKQSQIPGQDRETICGLLDSIKGKLDDEGGSEANGGSGQIMAYMNDPQGRLCDWEFPRTECYGVRLPIDYQGELPAQMQSLEVPEGEYLVFEHGPFDYEQENRSVEEKIEWAMTNYEFAKTGYEFDTTTPGRLLYFYHQPERCWKYVRPLRKLEESEIQGVADFSIK